jgi:hypothetical protein
MNLRRAALALAAHPHATASALPAHAEDPKPAAKPPPKGAPMGPPGPPVWHAESITESPVGVSFSTFWSKGRSLRAYTVIQGRPVLTLVHGDWYYAIDELGGKGIGVQRSPRALQEDAKAERPFGNEAEFVIRGGGEVIRSENEGSIKVNVWRLTDDYARREVWVPAEGARIPLRVDTFDRQMGVERRVRYVAWSRDIELPDRFFEPDPRFQIERFTYQQYLERTTQGPVPVLYGELLHGPRPEEGTPTPLTP